MSEPTTAKINIKLKKISARYDNLVAGYNFSGKSGKKYEVVETIGVGGMGAVYMGVECNTENKVAIKVEKNCIQGDETRKELRIAMEKLTMKACRSSDHFPNFLDSGRTDLFGWIAMELVGPSLFDLWQQTKCQKFSVPTCLNIAIQVVTGLRDLHTSGFVHRDLKPDNLAIGLGDKSKTVYILDTGISRRYKDSNGLRLKPRVKTRFQGSKDFSPLTMHREQDCGPRDDMESLFYILASFLTGKLPWSKIVNDIDIILCKHDCRHTPSRLFEGSTLCPILSKLWNYNDGLKFEDHVDYHYFINSLTVVQSHLNCANEPFDWADRNPSV